RVRFNVRSFPTRRGKYHLSAIRKTHNDARASKIAGFARRCKRRGPQWFALGTVCWVAWELEMPMLGDVAWILSGAGAAWTNEPSRNGRWRPWITARSTSKFGHYKAPLPRWRPCRKAERLAAIVTRTRRSSDFWAPRQGRVWRAPSLRHCPGITHVIVRKGMAPGDRWT